MKRLSILIPTYNRRKLLEDTLQSIFLQDMSLENIEILISDDASTDGTKEYLKQVKDEYSQLEIHTYHHEKNLGGPGNWSFLLSKEHRGCIKPPQMHKAPPS